MAVGRPEQNLYNYFALSQLHVVYIPFRQFAKTLRRLPRALTQRRHNRCFYAIRSIPPQMLLRDREAIP